MGINTSAFLKELLADEKGPSSVAGLPEENVLRILFLAGWFHGPAAVETPGPGLLASGAVQGTGTLHHETALLLLGPSSPGTSNGGGRQGRGTWSRSTHHREGEGRGAREHSVCVC